MSVRDNFYRGVPVVWQEKIDALRTMLNEVGSIWPGSTRLSGYAEKGPYHCVDCRYITGMERCKHPVVKADPQVKKDSEGHPIVDPEHGCCAFVEPPR